MKYLTEIIKQDGLMNTARKFDFHQNNIKEMSDRNCVVINGVIYAPVKKRNSRKK